MDASHISRLRQEQDIALENTEENIAKWEKFKSDYEALRERLKTLPDKVSHPVMVPFGSVGLMPGRLVHTNEITVLLGDNWFAERSAKQAAEIVTRRLKSVKENLDQLYEQRKLLTPRQVFTKELQEIAEGVSDVKDIVEQYDSDTEREWRVQHKKNVRAHREKLRKEQKTSSNESSSPKTLSDDALWARLDELERRETERKELLRDEEDDDEEDDAQMKGRQLSGHGSTRVTFADKAEDDGTDTGSDDDITSTSESDYDTDTEEEIARRKMARITFTHSSQEKPSSPEEVEHSEPVPQIVSPSDIYKHFGLQSKPKSILKQKKVKHKVEMERQQATRERENILKRTPMKTKQAFTGTVVEKAEKTSSSTSPPSATSASESASTSASATHRPVSRFRAQREQRGVNR